MSVCSPNVVAPFEWKARLSSTSESQLSLRPLLHTMQPVRQRGVRTRATIEIKQPTLIPGYRHSAGPNIEESVMAGFRQWYDSDFITIME